MRRQSSHAQSFARLLSSAAAAAGIRRPAFAVAARPLPPNNPDWPSLGVGGGAPEKPAKQKEARRYYETALKIVPEEPSVLSNLGLSYMLTRELPNAEQTLRR